MNEIIIKTERLVKLLKESKSKKLDIITFDGVTVISIKYKYIIRGDDYSIYLITDDNLIGNIKLNCRPVTYIREYNDCIEITV